MHTYIYIYIHHYITLHYITLHCITLHYIALHCITLHYIKLNYTTWIRYTTYITYVTYVRYITYITYITYIYISYTTKSSGNYELPHGRKKPFSANKRFHLGRRTKWRDHGDVTMFHRTKQGDEIFHIDWGYHVTLSIDWGFHMGVSRVMGVPLFIILILDGHFPMKFLPSSDRKGLFPSWKPPWIIMNHVIFTIMNHHENHHEKPT